MSRPPYPRRIGAAQPEADSPARERGATLALMALSLAGLVGLVALVVDVGHGRLTRQTLIPATDAAALAAAQDLVEAPGNGSAACATAGAYLTGNAAGATMTGCDVTRFGASGGRVTVSAAQTVDAAFAPSTDGSRAVGSMSSAAFGPPRTVSGLRPLAFCYGGSAALRQLIDEPPIAPTTVTVAFAPDTADACGGSSTVGNFATLAFEDGASIRRIRRWVRNGYREQVDPGQPTAAGCADDPAACYALVDALADIAGPLGSLADGGVYVTFPVFDRADAGAVHLVGVIRARVGSFLLDGLPEDRFVELTVEPGLITGTCCGAAPGIDAGNQVIALCGVDPDDGARCEPGTGS